MSHFRNSAEIPIILVGTQDAISERSPRVIDDARARKLATDLKRCSYYETCATYGLNVERVFQDACQKIVQQRLAVSTQCLTPTNSRPTTPQGSRLGINNFHHHSVPSPTNGFGGTGSVISGTNTGPSITQSSTNNTVSMHPSGNFTLPHRHHVLSASSHHIPIRISADFITSEQSQHSPKWGTISHGTSQQALSMAVDNNNISKFTPPQSQQQSHQSITATSVDNLQPLGLSVAPQIVAAPQSKDSKDKDLPTPTSTPTTSRKSRRRSNLFIPSSKKGDDKLKNGELGSGRSIPIKQGYLYKRSSKSLNKEWKKKYVTLCEDGRLTYHPSLHDYMDDVHGKEVSLQYVTVKVPGQKPRGSKSIITNSALTSSINFNWRSSSNQQQPQSQQANGISEGISGLSLAKEKKVTEKVLLTAFDTLREPGKSNSQTSGDEGIVMSNSNSQTFLACDTSNKVESQTPNVKKRHRRMKSSGVKNSEYDDSDAFEFYIVSLDNKQWHFEAASSEERDEWVSVIEQEIFKSLQGNESAKVKQLTSSEVASMQSIRSRVPGNGFCVDCDEPNPDWASLNLGILMCIECSGIHRNLGSHISKVRSLGLDDWPPSHISVMLAIGNSLANSVWESTIRTGQSQSTIKPSPSSSREEKEKWIRRKYEAKEFLPLCNTINSSLTHQLVEAVVKADMKSIVLLLACSIPEEINATVSLRDLRTPLHLACAIGNLAIVQLLIWNHANINQVDHEGRSCLTYAKAAASLATSKSHHYSMETVQSLVDVLTGLGCVDPVPATASGTLPRRRDTMGPTFEKLPSSVI